MLSPQIVDQFTMQQSLCIPPPHNTPPKRPRDKPAITKTDTMYIRIFDETQSCSRITDVLERLYETARMFQYGRKKAVYLTTGDDYTHVVIFNYAMPNILPHIPREHVIGFSHKVHGQLLLPQMFVEYAQKYIRAYYVGDICNCKLGQPFIQGRTFPLYSQPTSHHPHITKSKIMSISSTLKLNSPGHRYRRELVNRIIASTLPIDIYGHGCIEHQNNQSDPRLCGSYPELNPDIMFDDYMFHVTVENYNSDIQYTSKLVNTLVRGTIPVYNGSYAYPEMVVRMCGNLDADFALLMDIIKDPLRFYRSVDIEGVKKNENLLVHLPQLMSIGA